MDLKFVKNTFNDGVADVLLYGPIGRTFDESTGNYIGIDGERFAEEILYLNNLDEVKKINVRINSAGGSMLDGYSIFSAIKNSGKECNTFIDGIGASIAGVIFQAGAKRYINDFGKLMIHEPSIGTQYELLSDKQKRMIDSFSDTLETILENNSKLDRATIKEMISAETWLSSSEAIEKGFADEVVNTGRILNTLSTEEILSVANEINLGNNANNIKKVQKMELVKNHLGLNDANATEKEIISAIDGIKNSLNEANEVIKTKETEIASKDSEIEDLTKIKNDMSLKVATLRVENAIEKGIFEESKKAELIETANNSLEAFDALVSAFKKPVNKITNVINSDSKPEKTFRELEKENPSKLEQIKNENPSLYAEMYKKQYGVEIK